MATVLVVEDDPALRMLCRVNLELENYRVLEAATVDLGRRAPHRSEQVNLVLLDLHVGEQGRSRARPGHPRRGSRSAAICLLSGTSVSDPPRSTRRATTFIRKPFELDVSGHGAAPLLEPVTP